MFWAAAIPAIASIAGAGISALTSSSAASANRDAQFAINEQNIAMQKEFAQHGIRWKVEDAQAAGIHPLYGLGAQTASFSNNAFTPVADTNQAGDIIARGGADIGRAIHATRTRDERHEAVMRALTQERGMLENQLLASQIARMSQVGPPMATPGGSVMVRGGDATPTAGELGVFKVDPHKVTTANPAATDIGAGPSQPQSVVRDAGGGRLQNFPNNDAISDQEATNPLMLRWLLTQSWRKPPANVWPKGAIDMRWSPLGWEPVYPGPRAGRYIGSSASRPGVRAGMHYLETTRGRF